MTNDTAAPGRALPATEGESPWHRARWLAARKPAWPNDALRIGFGVIWLIDAVLKWMHGTGKR